MRVEPGGALKGAFPPIQISDVLPNLRAPSPFVENDSSMAIANSKRGITERTARGQRKMANKEGIDHERKGGMGKGQAISV